MDPSEPSSEDSFFASAAAPLPPATPPPAATTTPPPAPVGSGPDSKPLVCVAGDEEGLRGHGAAANFDAGGITGEDLGADVLDDIGVRAAGEGHGGFVGALDGELVAAARKDEAEENHVECL